MWSLGNIPEPHFPVDRIIQIKLIEQKQLGITPLK
jgi:hypothetical protein